MSDPWDYDHWIKGFGASPLAASADKMPWDIAGQSASIVRHMLDDLAEGYAVEDEIAIAATATIENGATIKGPAIIGPGAFVASGAYIRGGCWLERDNIVGPACELKSSFMFAGSKLAHFNFVGDSLVGGNVNIEAGAIIANHRNEMDDPKIMIVHEGTMIDTGCDKFGSLIGDGCRIGANAVVAPGALLPRNSVVDRLSLIDQSAGTSAPG